VISGAIIGPIVNYGLQWLIKNDWSVGLVLSIILGIFGAVLPDILEPPKSRWHRKIFHSKILLILIVFITLIVFVLPWVDVLIKVGLIIVLFSYLGHLLMDSLTPAGLPFWKR
jgi:inner membrane protein